MAAAWKIFRVLVISAVALGLVGLVVLIGLLTLGSLDEWENSQQVYLRNRTGTPLQVALTVPRTALGVDTAWWGITTNGTAVVRAAVVRELNVPGLRRNLAAPALLGAADKLVAAGFENIVYYPGKYRTFNWYQNPDSDLWMARAEQPRPAFNAELRVLPLPSRSDSVQLVFSVAPDSLLWTATLSAGFRHSDPDKHWLGREGPKLLVSWRDRAGHPQRQLFPTNRWLDSMQRVADRRGEHNYQLTHYADYR
jgi:hypothetical protein